MGQLGIQSEQYIRDYWAETVQAVGAREAVAIHWDDFTRGPGPQKRPENRMRPKEGCGCIET